MDIYGSNRKRAAQKKYRNKQRKQQIVRMELQIAKDSKDIFDNIVAEKAEDYPTPYDKRQRIAKARVEVFENMMTNVKQSFIALNDRITALEQEIKMLTPDFYKDTTPSADLPETIKNLEDDPDKLKTIIAKLAKENTALKQQYVKVKFDCDRYQKLYEVAYHQIEELESNATDFP